MNKKIQKQIENLASTDDAVRMDALQSLLNATDSKVNWVYDAWDLLLGKLEHENSYQRTIGIKLLCNLAKSDTENRLGASLESLMAHTRDEKFITARQCIQSIWKAAVTNKTNRERVMNHLEKRFADCVTEKHYNLLRQDIIQSMLAVSRAGKDDIILKRAQALIAREQDQKYRKQYEALLMAG